MSVGAFRTATKTESPAALNSTPLERPGELLEEAGRHLLLNADVHRRAIVAGVVERAEDVVPQQDVLAVVLVALAQVLAVMPAMKFRRVEPPRQRAELHVDV